MDPPSSPQEIAETMSQSTGENPSQEQVPDSLGSLDPEPRVRKTTSRFDPSTPLRPTGQSTVRCTLTRAGGGAGGNGGRGEDRAGSPELPNNFSKKVQNREKKKQKTHKNAPDDQTYDASLALEGARSDEGPVERRNLMAEMLEREEAVAQIAAQEATTPGKKRGQRRAAGGGVVGDGGAAGGVRQSNRAAARAMPGNSKNDPMLISSTEEEDLSDAQRERRLADMPYWPLQPVKQEPDNEPVGWSEEPKKLFEKVSIREPQLFLRAGGVGYASKPHDGGGVLMPTFDENTYPWKLRRQLQNLPAGRENDLAAFCINPGEDFTAADVKTQYKEMLRVVRVNETHQIEWTDEQRAAADAAFARLDNARTNILAEFDVPNAAEVREFLARPEGETAQPLRRESLIFDHIGDAMARAGGADGGAGGGAAALPTPRTRTILERGAHEQALTGMHGPALQARAMERDRLDAAGTAAPRVERRILGPHGMDRLRDTGASGDVPGYIAAPLYMAQKRRWAEEKEREARDAQGGSGAGGIARPAQGTAGRPSAAKKKPKGTAFFAPNAFKAFGKTAAQRRAEQKKKQDLKDFMVACRAANHAREVYLGLHADEKAKKADEYEQEYENQKAYVEFLKQELKQTGRKSYSEYYNKKKSFLLRKLWKRNDYRLDKLVLKMNKVLGGAQALDAYHKGVMSAYEKLIYGKTADTDEPEPHEKYVKFLAGEEVISDRDEDVGYDGEGDYVWKGEADEDDEEDVPEQDEDDEEGEASDADEEDVAEEGEASDADDEDEDEA